MKKINDENSAFNVPQGRYELHRLPKQKRVLLRAWDAADEHLLAHLAEQGMPDSARVLIMNDGFGALAVALNAHERVAQSDSYLSRAATRLNLALNDMTTNGLELLDSLAEPTGTFDYVLIKIPRTLALLEYQLIQLRPHINADTTIIAAGMVKAMPASAWQLMERLIGPTRPSRAVKKSRLIFVQPDLSLAEPKPLEMVSYSTEKSNMQISSYANVFSRERLDIGTRFFLDHLPQVASARDIVDLGCGNGVVGLLAAEHNADAVIHFVDESFMAVASARNNFTRAFGEQRQAVFKVGDGLAGYEPASVDRVLCNPPFHQQSTVGTQIARRMFGQAKAALRVGGELLVVGNRHLSYFKDLKRTFGNVKVLASNKKFIVLRARRYGRSPEHEG